jgi:hypothetical protein
MISDYVMKNINENFEKKTKSTLACNQGKTYNLCSDKSASTFRMQLKEVIKEQLPGLIRKNRDTQIIINETKPKSPSPFSKSRLKSILENRGDTVKSVIKRSPIKSAIKSAKSSICEIM